MEEKQSENITKKLGKLHYFYGKSLFLRRPRNLLILIGKCEKYYIKNFFPSYRFKGNKL